MQALPLAPHAWCGSWNYTIGPVATGLEEDPTGRQSCPPIGGGSSGRAPARAGALEVLSDPRFTGMNRHELDELSADLAPAQAAQTAQRRHEQRGGRRRRAPGAGSRSLLTDAARVLITVVYLRQICSQNVLSELLEVNPNSIGQSIAETRQLLDERGHAISATTLRFTTRRPSPTSTTAVSHPSGRGCPRCCPRPF